MLPKMGRFGFLLVLGMTSFGFPSCAQTPDIREIGSVNCSTEGGSIQVRLEGTKIQFWKGDFCTSSGCSSYEVRDFQSDGDATVEVVSSYLDGAKISYEIKVHINGSTWLPDTMMSMDYGTELSRDVLQIEKLYRFTEQALARQDAVVLCE